MTRLLSIAGLSLALATPAFAGPRQGQTLDLDALLALAEDVQLDIAGQSFRVRDLDALLDEARSALDGTGSWADLGQAVLDQSAKLSQRSRKGKKGKKGKGKQGASKKPAGATTGAAPRSAGGSAPRR